MQQPPIPCNPVPVASAFLVCCLPSLPPTKTPILELKYCEPGWRHILVELVVIRKYGEAVVQYLKLCMLKDDVIDDWTSLLAASANKESVRIQQMETFSNYGHDH
jgi:hypothetical protein